MEGFERVDLDFSINGGLAAVKYLEDILSSGHWSDRPLDLNDEWTMLLLRLIRFGDIAVFKRVYAPKKATPELMRRAHDLNMFIKKRHDGGILIDVANIFAGFEYDGRKTEYNSLFFPELKAYVRCGGIPPDRLLELLWQEGCETVFLFPVRYAEYDDAYFAFTLTEPKGQFLEEVEKTHDRISDMMHEIARKLEEKNGHLFPKLDFEIPKDK